ncbi:hypothetical protein JFL43_09465 [Viridibacillus sp. YIM B01967]|uniref:Uncharacterized protein n=1 Tax=Viridibacillus soli TaxID=2798301 RepID=A0ABS1H6N8_9BACL|nr:hypothetical protein [Viridibacillus soli]MBK3495080.1 hypothetical protein [Viridibacillus soli]
MKKIKVAFVVLIAIGGLAFIIKGAGGKSFEKDNSFEVDRIEELEINNQSWDIEFSY